MNAIEEKIREILSLLSVTISNAPNYSSKYISKLNKGTYREHLDMIRSTERKIIAYIQSGGPIGRDNLAKTDSSKRTPFLHAWLSKPLDNHRILYSYDPKTKVVTFLDIGTHKELGLGSWES